MKRFLVLFTATALVACNQQPASDNVGANAADGNIVVSAMPEEPANAPVQAPPVAPPPPPASAPVPDADNVVSEAPFTADSAQGAANVVQTYFALIESKRFAQAKALWGPAAAQAPDLSSNREYHAEVYKPGRIEGAAGSLYVTVPVKAYGVTAKGEKFEEPQVVTLRRVNNVDGSTAEQRRWHIAKIDRPPVEN